MKWFISRPRPLSQMNHTISQSHTMKVLQTINVNVIHSTSYNCHVYITNRKLRQILGLLKREKSFKQVKQSANTTIYTHMEIII